MSDTSVLGFLFRSSTGGIFVAIRAGEQCAGCDVHHIEDIDRLDLPIPVTGTIGIEPGGVTGGPKVITFDEVPTTLEMLKDGIISATISQQPVRQGSRSLDILFEYLTSGILPEQEQNFVELSIKIRENI